jgi:hypothetical protein
METERLVLYQYEEGKKERKWTVQEENDEEIMYKMCRKKQCRENTEPKSQKRGR